ELGLLFWVQWLAGLGSLALAGWVLAVRPRDFAARLLFISASGSALGIWSSAIYTTRDIAIDGALFRVLSIMNGLGIVTFAIAFAALLLVYPRPFVTRSAAAAMLLLPILASIAEAGGWVDDVRWTRVMLVAGGLLIALVLALAQWRVSLRDPLARAAMRWIFLSLLASLVFFAAVAVLPSLHGRSLTIPQGYMMAFSLVFFSGIAVAVARYRLFSIENWAHRLLFYLLGALLLFLLDVALVNVMHMASDLAFGIALLVVGFGYLPLRSRIWRWLTGSMHATSSDRAFAAASGIVLEPIAEEREKRWHRMLEQHFQPLTILPAVDAAPEVFIGAEGLQLVVPASTAGAAVILCGKAGGRALFQTADAELADSLIRFMSSFGEGRSAYVRGATAERMRIARDLHDDVGARLLSAMHQSDETVRSLLKDTLADIRTLSGALAGEIVPLNQFLAETRHEASERLAQCGIGLTWPPLADDNLEQPVDYRQRKALASAIREVVTNIIKHSGADKVCVSIEQGAGLLTVIIADNGRLAANGGVGKPHNGLRNIDQRIRDIGGTAHFNWSPTGLTVTLSVPFEAAPTPEPEPRSK
ncbi:MAG: histidine kinase, partial [Proteobacteria bacterium]|nr:histidine kinase [Pseudomonadota bacterium]